MNFCTTTIKVLGAGAGDFFLGGGNYCRRSVAYFSMFAKGLGIFQSCTELLKLKLEAADSEGGELLADKNDAFGALLKHLLCQ